MRKTFLFVAVLAGMVFGVSGSALAQTKCDPKKETCKEGTPCSPGFYKKHLDFWVDVYCGDSTDPSCGELLDALTCKGADATCGRSAAAAFLNDVSGCTE